MFFYFLFPWQSRYDRINSQRQTFVRIFRGVIRFMFTFKFIYGLRNRPCPFRVQSKCIYINGNKFKLGHQISRTLLNIVNLQIILDYNKKCAYSIIYFTKKTRETVQLVKTFSDFIFCYITSLAALLRSRLRGTVSYRPSKGVDVSSVSTTSNS